MPELFDVNFAEEIDEWQGREAFGFLLKRGYLPDWEDLERMFEKFHRRLAIRELNRQGALLSEDPLLLLDRTASWMQIRQRVELLQKSEKEKAAKRGVAAPEREAFDELYERTKRLTYGPYDDLIRD